MSYCLVVIQGGLIPYTIVYWTVQNFRGTESCLFSPFKGLGFYPSPL